MAPLTTFDFDVLTDPRVKNHSLPAFMVSTARGFLPRDEPIAVLPSEFEPLESLLTRMPIQTASGSPGLLATGKLGQAVVDELPDLCDAIEKYRANLPLMNALYRDYSFLLSAYLLEPCHLRFMKGESYGLGRQRVPRAVALPMVKVAEIAGFKPFMEYAGSYALYNYRMEDASKGLDYDNLRLIRAFEKGLDPTSSEAGFVLVHIAMVKHSPQLIRGTVDALDALIPKDREAFNEAFRQVVAALKKINGVMETMWKKSKPDRYTSFRTFIFGIKHQSMFPDGVVYEGVSEKPMEFRGESGANDSMIPLMDNLLQIAMPETPLTDILTDFRNYRPGNHREFLEAVRDCAKSASLKKFALEDPSSAALYLFALDQVRDFRWRHWCFAREYILKQTSHPTATGGSPIVTWLPNQLSAVLAAMEETAPHCKGVSGVRDVVEQAEAQAATLRKEVTKYCEERGVKAG